MAGVQDRSGVYARTNQNGEEKLYTHFRKRAIIKKVKDGSLRKYDVREKCLLL